MLYNSDLEDMELTNLSGEGFSRVATNYRGSQNGESSKSGSIMEACQ